MLKTLVLKILLQTQFQILRRVMDCDFTFSVHFKYLRRLINSLADNGCISKQTRHACYDAGLSDVIGLIPAPV